MSDEPGLLPLALLGPTASGKSALALALAARRPIEIISVDSAQVYRGMDLGTAKPSPEERARVPHHLIDILEPTERYSAARFAEQALQLCTDIQARGRRPVLVGGTMLYFRALREGMDELPGADAAVRTRLDAIAARDGWPALHARLARIDPQTAARLEPHDAQRIQRALEVHELTGAPLSAHFGTRQTTTFRAHWVALVPETRSVLHERIAQRFDAILAAGLIDEVRGLQRRYALSESLPSMRCVGYRQVWQFLAGRLDRAGLREAGVAATRQLAKRQFTWLRKLGTDLQIDPLREDALAPVLALLDRAGSAKPAG